MYLCVFIITAGDIETKITRETEQQLIKETKKNEFNQMKKSHIHGLSLYICCVLIYLMPNDKSIDVCIPLLNCNGLIRKK